MVSCRSYTLPIQNKVQMQISFLKLSPLTLKNDSYKYFDFISKAYCNSITSWIWNYVCKFCFSNHQSRTKWGQEELFVTNNWFASESPKKTKPVHCSWMWLKQLSEDFLLWGYKEISSLNSGGKLHCGCSFSQRPSLFLL